MNNRILQHLPKGPPWYSKTVTLPNAPNEPQTFYFCDIIEVANSIFGDPSLAKDMHYGAHKTYKCAGPQPGPDASEAERQEFLEGLTRVYEEMWTGRIWNEEQVSFTMFVPKFQEEKTHNGARLNYPMALPSKL
jgi:hypothetical protein